MTLVSTGLTETQNALIRGLVRRETGIELSSQDYLIKQRLDIVARRAGYDGAAEVISELAQGGRHKLEAEVVEAMTTNVTSFFRDPGVFECIADRILPELIRFTEVERRPLVIWSAACSSGQEPVSLAILLNERFPAVARPGRVRIVASDISPAMVERTADGLYSRRDVGRGLTDQRIERHFERAGDEWATRSHIRDLIETRTLNLLGSYAGVPRCDLVLVRNVLIYFSPANRTAVLERIRHEALGPGGSLVLGGSEGGLFNMSNAGFRAERLNGGTRYIPI